MRILYLCLDEGIPLQGRKGASVHVRAMVAALGRAGHEVVLAGPVLRKSVWEEPTEVEVGRLLHLPPEPEALAAASGLRGFNKRLGVDNTLPGEVRRILYQQAIADQLEKRFDRQRPDFVYERLSLHGTAGATVAEALGVPFILEVNAPLALEHATYRGAWLGELATQSEAWALRRADAVLVVSQVLRQEVIAHGVDAARVHVVPNGVDPDLFQPGRPDPADREELGLSDGPVLGFLGSLRPWHGVELLPQVLSRVVAEHPKARLLVVGDGELRERLVDGLREQGLDDQAVLVGSTAHERVPPLLRLMDVALAPYPHAEHSFYFSPLKLFEYMACGAAVVATSIGQIAEVVEDGRTGLLCSPGDVEALSAACLRLIDDPGLRARIASAGAEEVRAGYTWDANAARVVAIAQGLVGDR